MAAKKNNVQELLRTGLSLGFGLVDLTKTKAESLVKYIQKEYDITPAQSKKVVDDLLRTISKHRSEYERMLKDHFGKIVDSFSSVTKPASQSRKKKR